MAVPHPAPPALLVLAVTTAPSVSENAVTDALVAEWGAVAHGSDAYDFDTFTDYYAPEMGRGLCKRLVVFQKSVHPDQIASVKMTANRLERLWCDVAGRRQVNLDPGYLTPGALVLASTKPASHRIYLRDGIHAEVTLRYERGTYEPLAWTYPDFRQPMIRDFLSRLRPAALALERTGQQGTEQ